MSARHDAARLLIARAEDTTLPPLDRLHADTLLAELFDGPAAARVELVPWHIEQAEGIILTTSLKVLIERTLLHVTGTTVALIERNLAMAGAR